MIASQNWLKECYSFTKSPNELADGLTMLGIEVESIKDNSSVFKGFYTGKVVSREPHPNADKLSICMVQTGKDERIIICGAPNVAAGQHIIVATDGAIVPNGGFSIGKRSIRGVESNGMICSKFELNLGEDDGGIWVLPENTPIGIPLADFIESNDIIYEIGITPNRADCLSHIGLAREIACLENQPNQLKIPGKEAALQAYAGRTMYNQLPSITINNSELCHRYAGLMVRNVTISESPDWLKKRLESVGLRPKNVIVDITNYVLMETGQPLHAFDADTLAGNAIIVKTANSGEKFTTLDGKDRILDEKTLMICDAEKPIAIAGVMGGKNSEISDSTKNVFIESAYFFPSSIRRTAKTQGISSDAAYRFERGVDIDLIPHAAMRAAQLMVELAGGTIFGDLDDHYPTTHNPIEITLRNERARAIIGMDISAETIVNCLQRIGCSIVSHDEHSVTIQAPSWRIDINEEIDLVEEVARIINYDEIPEHIHGEFLGNNAILPALQKPVLRDTLREYLLASGFNELVTFTFTDKQTASVFTEQPVMLANPLGEEFSAMRPSLIPASLDVIVRNVNNGQKQIALFDIGRVFTRNQKVKSSAGTLEGFQEQEHLLITLAGLSQEPHWQQKSRQVDFYDIKGIAEAIIEYGKIDGTKVKNEFPQGLIPEEVMSKNVISLYAGKKLIGCAGQLHPAYCKKAGCDIPVFAALFDLTALYASKTKRSSFKSIITFPEVERDMAFIVDNAVNAESIMKTARQVAGNTLKGIDVFDVFSGQSLGAGKKSIGLRFTFQSPERTLIEQEIHEAMQNIVEAVIQHHNASLRA